MEQHMQALERANEIRLARARITREVAAGTLSLAEILEPGREIPVALDRMPIAKLFQAQRRWGETRARRFLSRHGIRENRAIGQLTERQRQEICDALAQRVAAAA